MQGRKKTEQQTEPCDACTDRGKRKPEIVDCEYVLDRAGRTSLK